MYLIVRLIRKTLLRHDAQRTGLAAVLAFITSSPEPLLIEKLKLKLITKAEH